VTANRPLAPSQSHAGGHAAAERCSSEWALTTEQVTALFEAPPALPRTLIGRAVRTGLRRGELLALRWSDVDERLQCLSTQAVDAGVFSTPKTAAGRRQVQPATNGVLGPLFAMEDPAEVDSDVMFGLKRERDGQLHAGT